jgi:peptide/nickel transport system substrate-binding protein
MTCSSPGSGSTNCGAGIKSGQKLSFTLDYSTGTAAFTSEASVYKSDASKAGIQINVVGQSFNTVIGESTPCPTPGSTKLSSKCTAQALMYGGWLFNGPGFEPTGEPLFETGAGSNSGNFSNPQVDSLINATHTNSSLTVFHNYATVTAKQLPYIWMPNAYTVEGVNAKLHGVTFNSFGSPAHGRCSQNATSGVGFVRKSGPHNLTIRTGRQDSRR